MYYTNFFFLQLFTPSLIMVYQFGESSTYYNFLKKPDEHSEPLLKESEILKLTEILNERDASLTDRTLI